MKNTPLETYGPIVPGAIKPVAPDCPVKAVIPSVTVQTVANIKSLAGCFVHVIENNTTYYIDDEHRIITTWASDIDIPEYDYAKNPRNLRGQTVYDFSNNRGIRYDNAGEYRVFALEVIK